jgi:hypothetical protein
MDKVRMTLEIWAHGTHDDPDVNCEMDVLMVSGENIPTHLLEQIINQGDQVSLLDDFGHFPAERCTRAVVDYIFEDYGDQGSGWWAEIISYEVLPQPENQ